MVALLTSSAIDMIKVTIAVFVVSVADLAVKPRLAWSSSANTGYDHCLVQVLF